MSCNFVTKITKSTYTIKLLCIALEGQNTFISFRI